MMKRITALLAAMTLLAVSPAQGGEPSKSTLGFDSETQLLRWMPRTWAALRLGSWNTMLQPWLPYKSGVIQALTKTNLDVLALQEVWTDAAKNRILSDPIIRDKYPYHYHAPAEQKRGACVAVPRFYQEDFISCLTATGIDTRTLEQPVTPVSNECKLQGTFLTLSSQACYSCIVNTLQERSPSFPALGVIERCEEGDEVVEYAHGGSPGMLILSKRPLQEIEVVPYTTHQIRRVIVYATVAGVRFAFVHLPLNYLAEIDSSLASFQRGPTQAELVQDLIAKRPDVVVGDFNSGPDYQPAGHNLLVANGYNPLFSKPTYCPQSTHATFPPCQVAPTLAPSVTGPASIDNVYINTNAGFCLPYTFANQPPVSDHIGVSALCGLRR